MNSQTATSNNPLTNLKILFQNRPEILKMLDARELDLSGLESEAYVREQKKRKLYPEPVNFYATGRTGAGKTSLGNALLGSGAMKATGHQDCTDFVGYFTLASNLQYFDLPGAGSNEDYENINRAALLIEQIEDEFADPEIKPIKEFDFINFSDYETEGIRKETIKVEEWQSQENQRVCSADIILYVVAPHMLLTRDDQKYLADLLKSHKQRYPNPRIIFALNIHRTPTGEIMPTPQNMEDAKKIISKIYLKFYPDSLPSIVEIDSRTGMGINKITELICQILPPEKIGNMQQVLRDELKQFAQKERSRRYRQTLAYIAARLATYPVDTP
jgi:tRNA U34 5-carboxymethylaminomethyl modifying GTPase MnmE/TrmE